MVCVDVNIWLVICALGECGFLNYVSKYGNWRVQLYLACLFSRNGISLHVQKRLIECVGVCREAVIVW